MHIGFHGFDFMFILVPIIVMLGFVFVFGLIIYSIVQNSKEKKYNDQQPILDVPAKVVSKRADVSTHRRNSDHNHSTQYSSSTTYFVTFEFNSGDRKEFKVSGAQSGMLVENDSGLLRFQGNRYLDFKRQ